MFMRVVRTYARDHRVRMYVCEKEREIERRGIRNNKKSMRREKKIACTTCFVKIEKKKRREKEEKKEGKKPRLSTM